MKLTPLLTLSLLTAMGAGCSAANETLASIGQEKNLVASWDFDHGAAPQTANGWAGVLSGGTPHFEPGLHGQGVDVDELSRNVLSAEAADCTSVNPFTALHGATLAAEKEGTLSVLHVRTDGQQSREGFQVQAVLPPLPATQYAVASLRIGGSGRVCIQLIDDATYTVGAPLYLELKPELSRVSAPPIRLAVPAANLRLSVTSVDKTAADFRVALLQIEPLPAATSWMPGATQRESSSLEYTLSGPATEWKTGTFLVWAKPYWTNWSEPEVREDGKRVFRTFMSYRIGNDGPAATWTLYGDVCVGANRVGASDMMHGGWHLIAFSWQGADGMIYFDGKTAATYSIKIWPKSKVSFGPAINCTLDEAAVFSVALTKDELDKVYAAGTALAGK